MGTIPEVDQKLVHQDTRIKLSEALEAESKYKVLAQQLLDRVTELEEEVQKLTPAPSDNTE